MRTLTLLLLLVAACGGDDASTADAPVSPDAPGQPDAGAPDASAVPREGIVILGEQVTNGNASAAAGVTLSDGPLFGGPTGSSGGCNVYLGVTDNGLSAGDITVTGTTVPLTLSPDGTTPPVNYSSTPSPPDDLLTPGATLTITAAGAADVGAFSGTVVAPDPLAGVTLPTEVSLTNATTVTWTAGTADEMWAWVLGIGGGANSDVVWCRMPDNGTFTFPSAALGMLPAADTMALVVLWRTNATPVTAGGMHVALTAADASGAGPLAVTP